MGKKITFVINNDLYEDLKDEVSVSGKTRNRIVAEALTEWLNAKEDERLLPVIDAAMKEGREKGFIPWEEVKKKLDSKPKSEERRAGGRKTVR
jgi:predicted transcriptional regulator